MEAKICPRCKERPRAPRNAYCKECNAAIAREWREAHPERWREIAKKSGPEAHERWLAAHPEERREWQREYEQTPARKEYRHLYYQRKKAQP